MEPVITPTSEVKEALCGLGHAEVQRLAQLSGVGFMTLWRIRSGETGNPGIETVRKFWPHIKAAQKEGA